MRYDLTFPLTRQAFERLAALSGKDGLPSSMDLFGHAGTHLDLMGKDYPEDYFQRPGRLFDVRGVTGRDIEPGDFALDTVRPGDFVLFHSGCLAAHEYGTKDYVFAPIQLSGTTINALLERKISLLGIDFAGVRLPAEHAQADRLCAEAGTFVVENLYGLANLAAAVGSHSFTVHTYPMRLEGATGLPCRVVAEV